MKPFLLGLTTPLAAAALAAWTAALDEITEDYMDGLSLEDVIEAA